MHLRSGPDEALVSDCGASGEARPPWRVTPPLAADAFESIRRRMMLEYAKWDAQIGDTGTIAEFALVLTPATWRQLAQWAERLTAELFAADDLLLERQDLLPELRLPSGVACALGPMPDAPRLMRFDFHWTTDGWRISEVNSDVPGGFAEAWDLARFVSSECPGTQPIGDPAGVWLSRLLARLGGPGTIAIVADRRFLEDQQVASYLARRLRELGCTPHVLERGELRWDRGLPRINAAWFTGPVIGVVRFFQAEWLAHRPRRDGWRYFFGGAKVPVTNPGRTLLSESKRFPIVLRELGLKTPTWGALLPETRDPREAPWTESEDWILKSAWSNTGDTVTVRALVSHDRWTRVSRDVRRHPGRWVAQRRFEPVTASTPRGPMCPCFGVYTVDGRAAGIYGRLSSTPVVDVAAVDVAVLTEAGPRGALA